MTEDQQFITQILLLGCLMKFIWIIVLESQIRQIFFFISGFTFYRGPRSHFQCPLSQVSSLLYKSGSSSQVLGPTKSPGSNFLMMQNQSMIQIVALGRN